MQLPEMANPPPALDPTITYRENQIEAICESLERMRKVAHVQGFEVHCDEGPHVGGDNTAPSPLGYFVAGVGFWLLTQIGRYGHMLKISVDKARVHVTMRNKTEGSVLQGTVQAGCLGFETQLEIESSEPPERIQQLVAMAEQGCFTMQALLTPVTFEHSTTLNGQPLA